MVEKIYINLNAGSIASARVESATDPTPKSFQPLVVGDVREFDFFLTDGNGNLETSSDVRSLDLKLGSPGNPLAEQIQFLPSSGGFRMSLNLSSQTVKDAVSSGSITTSLELSRTTFSGETRTLLQAQVDLTGQVSDVVSSPDQVYQECLIVSLSGETEQLVAGSDKVVFRMPFSMDLLEVRASLRTAPLGSSVIVDINQNGASVLGSQLIEVEAYNKSSQDSTNLPIIANDLLTDDSEISIDIDQVGSSLPGSGLKVYLSGRRS
jgi:hypothetical protein